MRRECREPFPGANDARRRADGIPAAVVPGWVGAGRVTIWQLMGTTSALFWTSVTALLVACDPMCPIEVKNESGAEIVIQQYQGVAVTVTNGGLGVVPPFLDHHIKVAGRLLSYGERRPFIDENVCIKYGRTPLSHKTPSFNFKFDKTVFLTVTSDGAVAVDDAHHIPLQPQPDFFPRHPQ